MNSQEREMRGLMEQLRGKMLALNGEKERRGLKGLRGRIGGIECREVG